MSCGETLGDEAVEHTGRNRRPGWAPAWHAPSPIAILLVAFGIGLALRYLLRAHTTPDTLVFSLPWYDFARTHGFGGLKDTFTNYTPFYSYLLLSVTHFDGLGRPLSLIKAISTLFEFGCASVIADMVRHASQSSRKGALAFAGVWLAPTVLFNGAMWGQADATWTFFTLLSVSSFMRGRNGVVPFAIAVAVKAQAVFLGPFMLGMILRRRLHWAWLLAVPVVYVGLAVPVLVAGRPLASVLAVYADQADYYHDLYKGAANPWLFLHAVVPYGVGLVSGLALAGAAGMALAIQIGRSRRDDPAFILLAACVSLYAMPFLLPKMHDRFFYGFELAVIALAVLKPRYLAVAVIAQLDGVLAYLAFDLHVALGVPVAALCNAALGITLVTDLYGGGEGFRLDPRPWARFGASSAALLGALALLASGWHFAIVVYIAAASAMVGTALTLLRDSRGTAPAQLPPPVGSIVPAE